MLVRHDGAVPFETLTRVDHGLRQVDGLFDAHALAAASAQECCDVDIGIALLGDIAHDACQLVRIQMRPVNLGAHRPQRLQRGGVADRHHITRPCHQRLAGTDGQADLAHLQQP